MMTNQAHRRNGWPPDGGNQRYGQRPGPLAILAILGAVFFVGFGGQALALSGAEPAAVSRHFAGSGPDRSITGHPDSRDRSQGVLGKKSHLPECPIELTMLLILAVGAAIAWANQPPGNWSGEGKSGRRGHEQSAELLQTVIDSFPEIVMVINRDYRVVLANEKARQTAGEDPVARGLKCYEASHHRDTPCEGPEDVCPLEQVVATKTPVTMGHCHRDEKGNENFVEISAAPIFDEDGEVVQIIETWRDITERKRAQEDLRAKERDEALVIRSVPMVLYSTEACGAFATTWTSGRVEEITGIEACRFIEEPNLWASRIHPEDRDRVIETFKQIPETGSCSMEYRWQHANGSWLWFLDQAVLVRDQDDRPKEIIGTWVDVTQGKQAELRLKEANERMHHLLSSTATVIYTAKSSGDYGATSITDNVKELVGYEPKQFLAESDFWLEHVHPEDRDKVMREIPKLFDKGRHVYEYRFRCKDGNYIRMRDDMRLIKDEKDNPIEIAGCWLDITKHRQADDDQPPKR